MGEVEGVLYNVMKFSVNLTTFCAVEPAPRLFGLTREKKTNFTLHNIRPRKLEKKIIKIKGKRI